MIKSVILCFLALLLTTQIVKSAQGDLPLSFSSQEQDTAQYNANPTRLLIVGSGHLVTYTTALLVLNNIWYADYPRSSFHFFNDNTEWLQMDKAGHAITAYHFSKNSYRTFRWAGIDNLPAAIWGSIAGSVFLTTIEILDGFSAQWGASPGDLIANTTGSAIFFTQQAFWNEQKIALKYSFSQSGLETYRPELLGENLYENMIKDYNGQTYWLSVNVESFTGEIRYLPAWLNIAVGYSAQGMLGGRDNPAFDPMGSVPHFTRYRQFYLAPDIDFSRIKTGSQTLDRILTTLNFIKFPAPAVEYNTHLGWQFHLVFF